LHLRTSLRADQCDGISSMNKIDSPRDSYLGQNACISALQISARALFRAWIARHTAPSSFLSSARFRHVAYLISQRQTRQFGCRHATVLPAISRVVLCDTHSTCIVAAKFPVPPKFGCDFAFARRLRQNRGNSLLSVHTCPPALAGIQPCGPAGNIVLMAAFRAWCVNQTPAFHSRLWLGYDHRPAAINTRSTGTENYRLSFLASVAASSPPCPSTAFNRDKFGRVAMRFCELGHQPLIDRLLTRSRKHP